MRPVYSFINLAITPGGPNWPGLGHWLQLIQSTDTTVLAGLGQSSYSKKSTMGLLFTYIFFFLLIRMKSQKLTLFLKKMSDMNVI